MDESVTLQKILEAAREEFLAKGFQSASLRNIVKTAGVTTNVIKKWKNYDKIRHFFT